MKNFLTLSVFFFTALSAQASTLVCKDASGGELLRAEFQAHEALSRVLSLEEITLRPEMATLSELNLKGELLDFVGENHVATSGGYAQGRFSYDVDQLDLYFSIPKSFQPGRLVGSLKYYYLILSRVFQRDIDSQKFVPNAFPLEGFVESREFFYSERTEKFFCELLQ